MRSSEAIEGTLTAEKQPHHQRFALPEISLDHLWAAIPFLLVIWLTAFTRLPALDFWWHLKYGEIIWNTRAIPTTEIFSYTAAGKEFLVQNWLTEVLYYLAYRTGGPALIVALNTTLLLAALLPIYLLCRRRSASRLIAALTGCFAVFPVAMTQGNIRPGIFSFVLFAWFYYILSEFRSGRPKLLWLLPALMALWANLHGAFVLGIALIVLFLGLDLVAPLFPPADNIPGKRRVHLLLVFALVIAATAVNPQFVRIYDYVVAVTNDPVSKALVTEWQAPRINQINDLIRFFAPFFFALFVLLRSRRRPEILDIGLLFAFAVFAMTAKRNGAWFAMVAAPILAAHLPLDLRFKLKPGKAGSNRWINLALALTFLFLTVRVLPWIQQMRVPPPKRATALLDPDLPVQAAGFLGAARIDGRMFHPQNWGDYLVWRLWPTQKSFFDGRVHVFGMDLAKDYFAIMRADADWEGRLDKYEIRYVLLNKRNSEQSRIIAAVRGSKNWKVRYQDNQAILFERSVR